MSPLPCSALDLGANDQETPLAAAGSPGINSINATANGMVQAAAADGTLTAWIYGERWRTHALAQHPVVAGILIQVQLLQQST